jgi:hypothetical protein
VATVVSGRLAAGPHTARWSATDDAGRALPSGVYLYRLVSGSRTQTRKLVVIE